MRRILATLLLLQPVLLVAFGIAHVPLEARALEHADHLQSAGSPACDPHSEYCQLCRTVQSASFASGQNAHAEARPAVPTLLLSRGQPELPVAGRSSQLGPRAPPGA